MENKFQVICDEYAQNKDFSGACLIKSKNETLFAGAYGYANRAFHIPNWIDTKFDVASITKIFTAATVLSLVEKGSFGLHDKITDIIDLQGTAIPSDVEIHHLLNQTSGIADDADEENGEKYSDLFIEKPNYAIRSCKDFLPNFVYKKSNFVAGTNLRYNNCAFILLGLAIEKVTGMDCREYMSKHIFEPCGMKNTKFQAMDEINENTAEGYIALYDSNNKFTGWKKNIYSYPPIGAPDGGIYTNCEDLDIFIRALSCGKILSTPYTTALFSPQSSFTKPTRWKHVPNTAFRYGYAFEFYEIDGQIFNLFKDGLNDGVAAMFVYYPKADLTVSILANQYCNVWAMSREMQTIIYDEFYHKLG